MVPAHFRSYHKRRTTQPLHAYNLAPTNEGNSYKISVMKVPMKKYPLSLMRTEIPKVPFFYHSYHFLPFFSKNTIFSLFNFENMMRKKTLNDLKKIVKNNANDFS